MSSNDGAPLLLVVLLVVGSLFSVAALTDSTIKIEEYKIWEQYNMTVERNAIWCFQGDLSTEMLENCVAHEIFDIYVCIGYPNADDYPALSGVVSAGQWGLQIDESDVTADLSLLASVDARLKLWAWAGTYGSSGHGVTAYVDFTSSGNRNALVAAMVDIAGWGFYGWHDDTEDYANSNTDAVSAALVAFWNQLGTAINGEGLKCSVYCPAVWYNFNTLYLSGITNVDYLIIVPRMDNENNWSNDAAQAISHASTPCMIDLSAGGLINQMSWFDNLAPSVEGFALYSWSDGGGISGAEWTAWDNWAPKDLASAVANPVFNPVAGTYGGTQNVIVTCATTAATIYYTSDGSTPDSGDTEYTVPIEVAASSTLKAIAYKDGYTDSAVSTAAYTINEPPNTPAPIVVISHLARLMRG